MKRLIQQILGRCVGFCELRSNAVLLAIVLVSSGVGAYVWQNFTIDSDLGKLITPAADLHWHQANEAFKDAFPQLQQTAVVVVSGVKANDVDASARRLAESLRASRRFEFVFAPALDPFLRDHRLYFLDADDLESWISGV